MRLIFLLFVCLLSLSVHGQRIDTPGRGYAIVTADILQRQTTLKLHWVYRAGDNPEWAGKELNDTNWQKISTEHLTEPVSEQTKVAFPGIGWFRYKFFIGPDAWDKDAIGIKMYQSGASEIYLDGKLIQKFGTVSNNGNTKPYNPQFVPFSLPGLTPGNHVLAVRYSNGQVERQHRYDEAPGFRLAIGYVYDMGQTLYSNTLSICIAILLLLAIFFTLSVVHLFLYLYDRKVVANLYFSGFTFSMALWFVGAYGTFLETNVQRMMLGIDLTFIAMATASFSLSGFSNTLFSKKKTRFYIIAA